MQTNQRTSSADRSSSLLRRNQQLLLLNFHDIYAIPEMVGSDPTAHFWLVSYLKLYSNVDWQLKWNNDSI